MRVGKGVLRDPYQALRDFRGGAYIHFTENSELAWNFGRGIESTRTGGWREMARFPQIVIEYGKERKHVDLQTTHYNVLPCGYTNDE